MNEQVKRHFVRNGQLLDEQAESMYVPRHEVVLASDYDALLSRLQAAEADAPADPLAVCHEADAEMGVLRNPEPSAVTPIESVLNEALEYFEDREDVVDGPYGEPAPNKEMALAQMIRAALTSTQEKP